MNNSTNTIIVLLTITAAILGAILIGSYTAGPAYAETSVKQGDYIMGPIGFSNARQLVYVIDMSRNKLNTYALDKRSGTVSPVEATPIDLDKCFIKSRDKD
jgi:6-phosphogluconolactonase (cycloisomerase 2 family)